MTYSHDSTLFDSIRYYSTLFDFIRHSFFDIFRCRRLLPIGCESLRVSKPVRIKDALSRWAFRRGPRGQYHQKRPWMNKSPGAIQNGRPFINTNTARLSCTPADVPRTRVGHGDRQSHREAWAESGPSLGPLGRHCSRSWKRRYVWLQQSDTRQLILHAPAKGGSTRRPRMFLFSDANTYREKTLEDSRGADG